MASDAGSAATNYFSVTDSSINVLSPKDSSGNDQGLQIALGDTSTNTGGIRGSMSLNDIMLKPNNAASAPVLGSVKVNLEVLPGSYLEVMGR